MHTVCETLPAPTIDARPCGARRVSMLVDPALEQACGVTIAFTGREGGVSEGPYASLNLGAHVGDDLDAVMENRALALAALGGAGIPAIVPNQVHGSVVVDVDDASPAALLAAQQRAQAGADALVVGVPDVAAMLCFADCTPVIIVSPTGRFAVAHAGWRGVVGDVAPKALAQLVRADGAVGDAQARKLAGGCNVYIGPHIHADHFEVGEEVVARFRERFGDGCIADARHVSMLEALRISLIAAGADPARICDAGACTQCRPEQFFSYRASGGTCGRHGAIAFRKG